jgi:hypothetical protein
MVSDSGCHAHVFDDRPKSDMVAHATFLSAHTLDASSSLSPVHAADAQAARALVHSPEKAPTAPSP